MIGIVYAYFFGVHAPKFDITRWPHLIENCPRQVNDSVNSHQATLLRYSSSECIGFVQEYDITCYIKSFSRCFTKKHYHRSLQRNSRRKQWGHRRPQLWWRHAVGYVVLYLVHKHNSRQFCRLGNSGFEQFRTNTDFVLQLLLSFASSRRRADSKPDFENMERRLCSLLGRSKVLFGFLTFFWDKQKVCPHFVWPTLLWCSFPTPHFRHQDIFESNARFLVRGRHHR